MSAPQNPSPEQLANLSKKLNSLHDDFYKLERILDKRPYDVTIKIDYDIDLVSIVLVFNNFDMILRMTNEDFNSIRLSEELSRVAYNQVDVALSALERFVTDNAELIKYVINTFKSITQ